MVLLYILLSVYILAVNLYSFLLIKSRRVGAERGEKEKDAPAAPPVREWDGKILLTALLGGALTLYVCMFVFRYRLNNLLLMLALPVLAALNVYLFVVAYRSGFGLTIV